MKRRDIILALPLALALQAGAPFAAEEPEVSIYLNPN
jgi:hypothetical protein